MFKKLLIGLLVIPALLVAIFAGKKIRRIRRIRRKVKKVRQVKEKVHELRR